MKVIESLKKDKVYSRLLAKFNEDGPFTFGYEYDTTLYLNTDFGRYIYDIQYEKISLYDVPNHLRTDEFYTKTFYYTYDYIASNIRRFNREFFKNLITTYDEALRFEKNCFAIMPIEYIDEEMVSIAVLSSLNWAAYDWLLTVVKRKPEVISEDVWKLAARLYGRRSFPEILTITPEKYRDREWYLELFKCQYNEGMSLDSRDTYVNSDDKTVLMDYVPQEVLTTDFLMELIEDDPKNIARCSEYALETEVEIGKDNGNPIKKKIWQIAIEMDGDAIELIDLNEERINFFKSKYRKNSLEYITFRYHYRRYMMNKNKKKEKNDRLMLVALEAMIYAHEEDDPTKAIDNEIRRNAEDLKRTLNLLPALYDGEVPEKYEEEYDPEEYLRMMYEAYSIEVLEEVDYLLCKVSLPEGYTVEHDGYHGVVKDDNGKEIIFFYRSDNFYNRRAGVTYIEPIKKVNKKKQGNVRKLVKKD